MAQTANNQHSDERNASGATEVEEYPDQVRPDSTAMSAFLPSDADEVTELMHAVRMLVHGSLDPIFAIRPSGQVVYANEAYDEMFRHRRPNGTLGENIIDLEPEKGHLLERMLATNLARRPGDPPLVIESPSAQAAWTNRWYEWRNFQEFDDDGNVTLIIGVSRDITERRRSEVALVRLNERLEESNRDLLDFAHVASHDLQEPLRKVSAFADRLERKLDGQLDDQALDYMARMNNAVSRMQSLIDDLLTFARVNTRGAALAPASLDQCVEEVVSDLEVAIDEAGATVTVADLPELPCDETQMRQLFQNLIGNALKFRRDDAAPTVEVSAQRVAGDGDGTGEAIIDWFEISVADNGIGFDEQYAAKIFTPFQRLHSRRNFAGSGVGLSVCRRIAERHGGNITASSIPGEGSTFVVRLPSAELTAASAVPEQGADDGLGFEHTVIGR